MHNSYCIRTFLVMPFEVIPLLGTVGNISLSRLHTHIIYNDYRTDSQEHWQDSDVSCWGGCV